MIKAIIFDMDGLLIDSEPLWKKAEEKVFVSLGVPFSLKSSKETTGLRADEVVSHWYKKYPWKSQSLDNVTKQIEQEVLRLVKLEGKVKEGAIETVKACFNIGLPLAVASSSSPELIDCVLDKLKIRSFIKVIHSAHHEKYGKPHPAVYISTAKSLKVDPVNCLSFEDSVNGVLSAKSAKMKCIAVPDPENINNKNYGIADIILPSLKDFNINMI